MRTRWVHGGVYVSKYMQAVQAAVPYACAAVGFVGVCLTLAALVAAVQLRAFALCSTAKTQATACVLPSSSLETFFLRWHSRRTNQSQHPTFIKRHRILGMMSGSAASQPMHEPSIEADYSTTGTCLHTRSDGAVLLWQLLLLLRVLSTSVRTLRPLQATPVCLTNIAVFPTCIQGTQLPPSPTCVSFPHPSTT